MMNDNVESENPVGPASAIQAIDKKSVHRICSGQVVLTLATAVKELVENSLDAGATIIEVRLKEYGSELLEVIDNGCGVEEKNFEGLTLKHHTSKLRDFGDLVSVETFGFRGEALSSLCALSNLIVTTCHESSSIGTKLELDYNGKITSRQPCARQKGTTVSLGQLFHTLPVRHREFQRNLKKEFSKMVHVLNGYCIISTSVRITCTNQVGKGKKNIIASTNGNDNIKENITNIFGPKQVQSLLVFEQVLPSDTVCSEYNIMIPENLLFSVTGFISSSEHGKGRGVSDRQFTYINRRPFDHTKLSRVVNEVYHSYNRHQYPFVVLDITLDKESVDVNVTPDKRQVFISSEKILLAVVKTSLMKMFEPISSVFQVNQGQGKSGASLLSSFTRTPTGGRDSIQSDIRRCDSDPGSAPKKSLTSSLAGLKRSFSSAFDRSDSSPASTRETQPPKQRRLDTFIKRSQRSDEEASSPPLFTAKENTDPEGSNVSRSGLELDKGEDQTHNKTQLVTSQSSSGTDSCQQDSEPASSSQNTSEYDDDITVTSAEGSPKISPCHDVTLSDFCCGCDNETVIKTTATEDCEKESTQPMISNQERSESLSAPDDAIPSKDIERKDETVAILEYDQAEEVARKSRTISFSMAGLKNSINKKKRKKEDDVKFRSFRARISPADNQAAEQELQKEIKKDMFPSMEILGQFNLGFIITKHGSDLFIVDQHATDEKYNFEMLQRHTVIHSQKLIQPQSLELTAANSTVLIDNMEIFRTNGFEFDINEEAPITSRVRLASMPVSKNWTFGKDDIEELIFMLKDSPGVLCRPSRVRMMFASRACRKSIMVGTALSVGEMRKVVNHMAEIDQPWNCPHGRPTMRHLINLDCLQDLGQQS